MTDQTAAAPAAAPVTEDPQVNMVMEHGSEVIAVSQSEVDLIESDKAEQMRAFDDSRIRVMNKGELPVDMRASRGKAMQLVAIEDLYVVPGLNVRLDTPEWHNHIEWLTGLIMEHGFREDCPLLVFPTVNGEGKPVYGIISGESRYRAVLLANKRGTGIKTVPAMSVPEGMSVEEMNVQLATSNGGKEFSPLELATLAQRFSKWGRKPSEIAAIMKVTTSYVGQLLLVAKSPSKVRSMLRDGQVSFQVALAALKDDPTTATAVLEKGVEAAKKAGKDKLTSKFMPEHQIKKAARVFAPKMKDVLSTIVSNEGVFALMEEEMQQAIKEVLAEIEALATKTPEMMAKERDAKKADQAALKEKIRTDKTAAKQKPASAKKAKAPKQEAKTEPKPSVAKAPKVSGPKSAETRTKTAAADRGQSSVKRIPANDFTDFDDVQNHPQDA